MRMLLAFLLCFAVTFQGIANANVFKQPCPTEQACPTERGVQVAIDMPTAAGDCCINADTTTTNGKLCKTGQPCAAASSGSIASPQVTGFVPASSGLVPDVVFAALLIDLSDSSVVWRPPTFS